MASLADFPEVVGFFSYSRDDDESYKGRLSSLREAIQHELAAQLGRSKATFRLWQDKEAIAPGKLWEEEIKTAVGQSVFFIPIVTPRAVNSDYCKFEFDAFLARERTLGRTDLVFPILYVPVPALASEARWRDHPVLSVIGKRQYVDWQTFRHADVHTPTMREEIARYCNKIVEALHESWLTPDERRQQEEAQAQARAQAELRRQEAEARQRADEEARRQQKEAEEQQRRDAEETRKRLLEEKRRARAEQEAAAWRAVTKPFTVETLRGFLKDFPDGEHASAAESALQDLVRVERELEAAKRADSVDAIDKFLADHPDNPHAQAAREWRENLAAREAAYRSAIENGSVTVLTAFLDAYPGGSAAQDVRDRLLRMEREAAYRSASISDDPVVLLAYLDRYPQSSDAKEVRGRLQTLKRDQAYNAAIGSNDPALLKSFLNHYRDAPSAPEIRARLRKLRPRWPLAVGSALAIAVLVAVGAWVFGGPQALVPRPTALAPMPTPKPAPVASSTGQPVPEQLSESPLLPQIERQLGPKVTFKECSRCPQMIVVPAGRFMMGLPITMPGRDVAEEPQHTVTIAQQFAVGVFAVTFDEWDACLADGGCNGYRPSDEGWGRGRQPVINVSLADANAYIAWLSKKTGAIYRLLSDAEYEYAARAGTTTVYPWGDVLGKNNANCDGCGGRWDNKQTAPVGSFPANNFGLFDMIGNVWAWTQDCFHYDYEGAPTDGSAWTSGYCSGTVLRGGSWFDGPLSLRSGYHFGSTSRLGYKNIGFRVARTLLTH